MKKMSDYLDAYGAACGLTSDYQIAKDLGLTKQAVSRYRNDKGCFELDIAWRISDATGIDLAEIIAASEIFRAERAHDDARATLWRRRLQTVSASLCTAFIGVFLFFASPGPAHAGALPGANKAPNSVYYVKLKLLRGHRWMPLASYQSHQPDKAHFRVGCYQNGLIQTGHLFLIHEKEKTTT